MTAALASLRCPRCALPCSPMEVHGSDHVPYGEGYVTRPWRDLVSDCCAESVERVLIYERCRTREGYEGCEQCLSCIADEVVQDVTELDGCSKDLQAAVARELARRMRPMLSVRQAF